MLAAFEDIIMGSRQSFSPCHWLHLLLLPWLPSRLLSPLRFWPARACLLTRPLPRPGRVSNCSLIVRLDLG